MLCYQSITSNANEIHSIQLSRDVYCGDKHTGTPIFLFPHSPRYYIDLELQLPGQQFQVLLVVIQRARIQLLPVVDVLFGRCGAL